MTEAKKYKTNQRLKISNSHKNGNLMDHWSYREPWQNYWLMVVTQSTLDRYSTDTRPTSNPSHNWCSGDTVTDTVCVQAEAYHPSGWYASGISQYSQRYTNILRTLHWNFTDTLIYWLIYCTIYRPLYFLFYVYGRCCFNLGPPYPWNIGLSYRMPQSIHVYRSMCQSLLNQVSIK